MHLHRLLLTNFKNYESQSLDLSARLNLVTGLNGMGKTNLLDAVYYLCMGKSYFGVQDRQVAKHEQAFFRLEGAFQKEGVKEKIVAKVMPGKEKTLERNGVAYERLADHVGLFPVVFVTPDDSSLALEGSEERRRFLDNTLCQLDAAYLNHLMTYNRVLANRNAALKKFYDERNFNGELLAVYNRQLLEPGRYIFDRRKGFLEEFEAFFENAYRIISGERERAGCIYQSQLSEGDFAKMLEDATEKDHILQRSTIGIHKDDLFFLDERPLKRFASQGQLKSFVLSLKLAQFEFLKKEKGERPLLLLDDLFDKLDEQRVSQLLELLVTGDFGQVFISDTHPERAEALAKKFGGKYKKFVVSNGSVV